MSDLKSEDRHVFIADTHFGRFRDRVGEVLDHLTVLAFNGFEKHSETFPERQVSVWECKCLCGNTCTKRSYDLTKARGYKSCGCMRSSGNPRLGYKKVHGVGFNDLVGQSDNKDIFYRKWVQMLSRCYDEKSNAYRDYGLVGVHVCDEWLTFSNFKTWMEGKEWEGKDLDKDLLFIGNKQYSPERCLFVPPTVNTFLLTGGSSKSNTLVGATECDIRGKTRYKARVQNPITKQREYLGIYRTEKEAHKVWLKRKRELAILLGEHLNEPYYGEILLNNLNILYGED